MSLQAELESGLTELGQTEAKRLEALQVRLTVPFLSVCLSFYAVPVPDPGRVSKKSYSRLRH